MGRIRLHVALDCSGYSWKPLSSTISSPVRTIATDDWQSYNIIDKEQFRREITNQSKSKDYDKLYGAPPGDDPDQTIDPRNVSGTIRTEIPSELSRRVCLSIQSSQISKSIGKKFMRIVQQALRTPRITWPEIPMGSGPDPEYFAYNWSFIENRIIIIMPFWFL
jgi:hypothetical protein